MDLEYAMFANNAAPLGDGRLCIFGADFDGVRSDVFPCVVPPFVLIVKMRLNVGENPSGHTLRIELVNPNGEGHVVNESPIAAAPNDQRADLPSNAQVLVNVVMQFDRPGDYRFDVFIDGRQVKAKPFYVTQAGAPGPAG